MICSCAEPIYDNEWCIIYTSDQLTLIQLHESISKYFYAEKDEQMENIIIKTLCPLCYCQIENTLQNEKYFPWIIIDSINNKIEVVEDEEMDL